MRSWQFAVLALILSIVGGCRSDPAIPILERELRRKEDEIYRLRATVEELQDCGSCSDTTASHPKSTAAESDSAGPRHRPSSGEGNGGNPPRIEMPSQPASGVPESLKGAAPAGSSIPDIPDVPDALRGPSKPLGPKGTEPAQPSAKPPAGSSLSPGATESDGPSLGKSARRATSPPGRISMASLSASAVPLTPSGDSRRVTALTLNPTLTGSIVADDRASDQGLLVVIEPRDREGQTIDAPADVSVVVVDPAVQGRDGRAARVARWDFTAAETAAMFRRTGSSRAIHLTTAWPGDPPSHRKLHLFVRYVTADGRNVEAEQPIEVILPGDKTARWTRSEAAVHAEPPDREPATDSKPLPEASAAHSPGPAPYTTTASEDSKPRRPAWSPDRR